MTRGIATAIWSTLIVGIKGTREVKGYGRYMPKSQVSLTELGKDKLIK